MVALYGRFIELTEACGPFTYAVGKTAITLKGTRRGFAGASFRRAGALTGYLDLQRVVADPRIRQATPYTARLFVHHVRIERPDQLDATFAGWLAEAHAVGAGAHLANRQA